MMLLITNGMALFGASERQSSSSSCLWEKHSLRFTKVFTRLIKYWQMFDLILASFLQGECMVQRMDGWYGRQLPNNSICITIQPCYVNKPSINTCRYFHLGL